MSKVPPEQWTIDEFEEKMRLLAEDVDNIENIHYVTFRNSSYRVYYAPNHDNPTMTSPWPQSLPEELNETIEYLMRNVPYGDFLPLYLDSAYISIRYNDIFSQHYMTSKRCFMSPKSKK